MQAWKRCLLLPAHSQGSHVAVVHLPWGELKKTRKDLQPTAAQQCSQRKQATAHTAQPCWVAISTLLIIPLQLSHQTSLESDLQAGKTRHFGGGDKKKLLVAFILIIIFKLHYM